MTRDGRGRAQNGGLFLAVGTDFLETCSIDPDATAFLAIAKLDVAEVEIFQRNSAAWTDQVYGGDRGHRCQGMAAVGAKFGAKECQPKTGRAGDGGQASVAIGAGRRIGGK